MRITTYNLFGLSGYPQEHVDLNLGPLGEDTVDHFTGVFKQLDTDILALQEGSRWARTMQDIARNLDYHLATFPSPINWPGHCLSRFPIRESRTFSHLEPAVEVPLLSRCAGAALLDVPRLAQPLWCVVLHLYPGRESVSRRQAEAGRLRAVVEELLARTPNVVVTGDFNSETDEEIHRDLQALDFRNAVKEVCGAVQPTLAPAKGSERAIDHIYVSSALVPKLQDAGIFRGPGFSETAADGVGWLHSDHLPVRAELNLQ